MVKVPEGELTATEIRRMIKAHNKLMSIEIPKGTKRDGLIKLVEKNGYKIDHKGKKLVPSVKMKRKPTVNLPPAPPKKTKEEKEKAKKERIIKKKAKDEEAYQRVKGKVDAVKKIGEKRKARLAKVPKGSHRMPDGSIMKDKDMPKKKETGTKTDKDKIIKVWREVLNPQLREAYKNDDKALMKKLYNKSILTLAKYMAEVDVQAVPSADKSRLVASYKRMLNKTGNSNARLIKGYGEGKIPKGKILFKRVDISDLFKV